MEQLALLRLKGSEHEFPFYILHSTLYIHDERSSPWLLTDISVV